MRYNDEHGRSMIEIIGILALVGILSAAALFGYFKAMAKHKMNVASDQISAIVTNITNAFLQEENYAAISGATKEEATIKAIQLNIFPAGMVQEDGITVLNAYKGRVYVYAVDYNGVENGAYAIDYEGLPKETVVAFATPATNIENEMMMGVDVNGTAAQEDEAEENEDSEGNEGE